MRWSIRVSERLKLLKLVALMQKLKFGWVIQVNAMCDRCYCMILDLMRLAHLKSIVAI